MRIRSAQVYRRSRFGGCKIESILGFARFQSTCGREAPARWMVLMSVRKPYKFPYKTARRENKRAQGNFDREAPARWLVRLSVRKPYKFTYKTEGRENKRAKNRYTSHAPALATRRKRCTRACRCRGVVFFKFVFSSCRFFMRIRSAQVYRRARRCFENEENLGYFQFYNPQNERPCFGEPLIKTGPGGAKSIDFYVGGLALEGPWSKQAPGSYKHRF